MLGKELVALLQDAGALLLQPAELPLRLAHRPLVRRALGGSGGEHAGRGGKFRFDRGHRRGRLFGQRPRRGDPVGRFGALATEPRLLLVEPRRSGIGVAAYLCLVLEIGGSLNTAGRKLLLPRLELRLLAVERLGGKLLALQRRASGRGAIPQFRQEGAGDGLVPRRLRLAGGGGREGDLRGGKPGLRFGEPRQCGIPVHIVENRLRFADFLGKLSVADRLPGLAAQPLQARADLVHHVVEALDILLGRLELLLRLAAARMQPGNAGGVLQDAPPLLRLGGDQLGDLALADEGGGMRPGGGVGQQQLHVAGARFAAVDAVGGARFPFDAAGDLQRLRTLAHLCIDLADQRHLGDVARRPVGRAGKDDVVHAAAAHGLV